VIRVNPTVVGSVETNQSFTWDAEKDELVFSGHSHIFELMSKRVGQPKKKIYEEFNRTDIFITKISEEERIYRVKKPKQTFN